MVAMAGTDLTFVLISLMFRMAVPLVIIGVIIFLIVTDTNNKKGSVPVQYDAQGRPIPQKSFSLKGKFNTSTVLLMIGSSFIMLSADDKVVPVIENGIAYAKAFIKKDVPVSLHLYPIGGHGWGFKDAFVYKQQWTNELEKWLRETVK